MSAHRTGLELRIRLALDRFELAVELEATAPVTGVFGASGAGKSSLLRSIAGLEHRARGRIRLEGETWLDSERGLRVPSEGRRIGYVPQEGLLFPHWDVRRNLTAGARRARRAGRDAAADLAQICRVLELGPLLDRRPASLSGGERQRVALGRALGSGPRLLLLDEPLASLDLALRRRVLPFLRRIRDTFAIPMLLVSHEPAEIQALCDEVVVLDRGRVLTRGPVRESLTDPRVLPLTSLRSFENVLATVVSRSDGDTTEVTVGDGVRLVVPSTHRQPGEALVVGIPAREIVIADRAPTGLSARNALPAVVRGLRGDGDLRLLVASLGEGLPDLAAVVTPGAAAELALEPGRRIHLVVKTASVVTYGGEGD